MEKFFSFISPYLSYIDSGKIFRKPFSWLYAVLAALNLLFPFYVLYLAIDSHIFSFPAKYIIAFILVFLVLAAAGWISFQIWWDRKDKVLLSSQENSDFPATPVISHLFQTAGEWAGTWIACVGFFFTLIALIFLGDEASALAGMLQLPLGSIGVISLILFPIYGFLIIVGSRFLAELYRALAAIANNTKK